MDAGWSALVIDDDPGVRQSVRLCLEADHARVLGVATPSGALEALDRGRFDVIFLDLWLGREEGLAIVPEILRRQPGAGIIVITAFASFESAVEAMRRGAVDYLPKPFTPDQIRHAARRVISSSLLSRELAELKDRIEETGSFETFETQSSAYRAFLDAAVRAAGSDSVVLLRGESGTGKNVLARFLRARGRRAEGPFVTVHCPMLAGDLMTSALFGHRRGAFTGAVEDAPGKVEQAEGGTLFLDEVGDLTPEAQARLLRFLNDRTYERLGETRERRADVRIIAATNRRIEEEVKAGRFREDLLFRLNVISLLVPSLRERREDLLPLARGYLKLFALRQGRPEMELSKDAERALVEYAWPGNLRELSNAVERAVILSPARTIEATDLGIPPPSSPGGDSGRPAKSSPPELGEDVSIEEIEREHIARVLARSASLEAAARTLGIDATTLQRKRKRYGLA
jgi:NtrC-family two-component system response regulator AlgB